MNASDTLRHFLSAATDSQSALRYDEKRKINYSLKKIIMKRSLSSMMAALLLVCSCEDPGLLEQFGISPGELDSSNISERLDDLEDRVSKLEAWCDAANSNITALQAAVQALESEDCIVEIVPIEENGAEVGYRFEFKSGKTISVYLYGNSEDGFSGGTMPAIAVKQDTDGSWYWTIDGEWLYNEEGKKVPAVGATPKIKIEDNVWYVSYDEGKTWTAAGDAGDGAVSGGSVFSSVEYDKDYVYFTLTDGSLLTVQRAADFDIVFEGGNEQVYSPNDILEVAYTIAGGDEMSIVKAFASEGWSAKVEKTDAVSGIIRVTSPSESMDGEIIVFVSDGRDKTLMRTLSFESGVMSIIDDTYTVGHEAATIEVRLTTNLDYMVQTDAEWLSVAAGTKAVMREDVLVVTVEENTRGPRTAKIRLSSTSGHELQTISIYQEKDPDSTGEQEENYPLSDDFDESERYIGLTDIDINIELPISDPILHYQLTDAQELLQLSAEQIRYHMDNAVFDTDGNLVKGMRVCSVYDYGCVDMEMDNNGRLGGWLDSEGQPVPYLSETSVLAISMRCYKNYNDEWCFYDYVSYQLENINGEDNAWGNNKYTNAVNDALGKTIHYTYRITYLPESSDGDISLATIVNIHYQVHVVE